MSVTLNAVFAKLAQLEESKVPSPDENITFSYFLLDRPSSTTLYKWAQDNNIKNVEAPEKMHSTVVYSRVPFKGYNTYQNNLTLSPTTYRLATLNGALVLIYNHPIVKQQNRIARNCGAQSDYPIFIQHITISYSPGPIQRFLFNKLLIPRFPITFTREYLESITADTNI